MAYSSYSGDLTIARRSIACSGIALLMCAQVAFAQQDIPPKDALKVSIAPVKKPFHEGDPLQFSITITNVGNEWYLIPNHISLVNDPSSIGEVGLVEVDLRSEGGEFVSLPGGHGFSGVDCREFRPIPLRLEDVFRNYIFLRPGTSYVQQFGLEGVYSALRPGKYFFYAQYHAVFSPMHCTKWSKDDIEKFPFKPWYGSTAANKVSFEILPNQASITDWICLSSASRKPERFVPDELWRLAR